MSKHRNISRIETNRANGWRVRFEQGPLQVSKLFSDRVYGSSGAALNEAIQYRDELRGKLRTSQHDLGTGKGETNTGCEGITFYLASSGLVFLDGMSLETKPQSPKDYFIAEVRLSTEKTIRRRFPLKQAGFDRVLKQAVRWQRSVLKGRRRN